jgi:DNA-binding CsgD family transcriptional regulator
MSGSIPDRAVQDVVRACYSAGGLDAVRGRLLPALRRVVPFDAAFMAGADPDTLLFTSAFAEEPLVTAAPLFLDNEFSVNADVNRFVDLARARNPIASLDEATGGKRAASARWREIMAPLGMGDELRAALRVDGTAWGFLCLHRSGAMGFSASELAVLCKVAPHAGEAIRRTAVATYAPAEGAEAVILIGGHVVLAVAGAVEEIEGGPLIVGGPLPVPLAALARRLEAIEIDGAGLDTTPAAIRMTTRSGALVTVHAARLDDASGSGPIVLTIAPAAPADRSSLLLAAYGLTPAQCLVANLVLRGKTTSQIVVDLCISAHTVQDHLKVVFDKSASAARRELVNAVMHWSH